MAAESSVCLWVGLCLENDVEEKCNWCSSKHSKDQSAGNLPFLVLFLQHRHSFWYSLSDDQC